MRRVPEAVVLILTVLVLAQCVATVAGDGLDAASWAVVSKLYDTLTDLMGAL